MLPTKVRIFNTTLIQFSTIYLTQEKQIKKNFNNFAKWFIYLPDNYAQTNQDILKSYGVMLGMALQISLTTKVFSEEKERDLYTLIDSRATQSLIS